MFKNIDIININKAGDLKPAFSESNIPVFFQVNNEYCAYLAVAVQSLIVNSSPEFNYDIVIFESDIDENLKYMLVENIEQTNISIRFFDISDWISGIDFYKRAYFTKEIYFKLFQPFIAIEYDKFICLDADLIIETDIADLYKVQLDNYYFAAVQDVMSHVDLFIHKNSKSEKYFNAGIVIDDARYFNAGVLLYNAKLIRQNSMFDRILQMIKDKNILEQEILNIVFRNNILELDFMWNYYSQEIGFMDAALKKCMPADILEKYTKSHPQIIHYFGAYKPWLYLYGRCSQKFWMYARNTLFYETLLNRLMTNTVVSGNIKMRLPDNVYVICLEQNDNIIAFANNGNPNVIFGAHGYGINTYIYLSESGIDVEAFCDNDPEKQGGELFNIRVLPPNELLKFNGRINIIITTSRYRDVIQQLENMKIIRSV